jgi:hypothetical protein
MSVNNPELKGIHSMAEFATLKPGQPIKCGEANQQIGVFLGTKRTGLFGESSTPTILRYVEGNLVLELVQTRGKTIPKKITNVSLLEFISETEQRYNPCKELLDETIRSYESSAQTESESANV